MECEFGIIFSKWRKLSKPIETTESTAEKIIKTICLLHNIIIDQEGFERHLQEIVEISRSANIEGRPGRLPDSSKQIRDTFKWYICICICL